MKKGLVFILAMFSTFSGFAQHDLSGIVKDKSKGEPLAGATVRIAKTYKATATDLKGKFNFSNLADGQYNLVVTYVGLDTLRKSITLNADQNIELLLSPATYINDEVIVKATRSRVKSPGTTSKIDSKEIEDKNYGQDMPYLLQQTPSTVVTSDAGAGVGYTGIRIRGSDVTRINVTINGIPVNDAESHGVYWVDMPDLASSTHNILIQRGVGSSTNGAGAFGATINLQTTSLRKDPYGMISNSYGSFSTHKHTAAFGTGLIKDRWSFNGRASIIQSNGYIDRASSDLKSYYLSGSYRDEKNLLKFITFGGHETTYQAWNGVSEENLENNRTYNSAGLYYDENGQQHFYDREVDDYEQDYYQLHYSRKINSHFTGNVALHFTYGRGYYEQYMGSAPFSDYGLDPINFVFDTTLISNGDTSIISDTQTINSTDLIQRRWLDNKFYGITYSLLYDDHERFRFTLGGAYNEYDGDHFGEIIWARYASASEIRDHFYDNNGFKTDFNVFGKAEYRFTDRLTGFADLQYRQVTYDADGQDIGFAPIDVKDDLNFINPKVGLNYQISQSNLLYGFFGISHKEPKRDDYIDAPEGSFPEPEELQDWELGYQFISKNLKLIANTYYMNYKNQLVLTGELSDVGSPVRKNVGESYRTGIEFMWQWNAIKNLIWKGNASYSKNINKDYVEAISKEPEPIINRYENTAISFSPELIVGNEFDFMPFKGGEVALLSKYVGEQYLDNTENDTKKIDAYLIHDLRLSYSFKKIDILEEVKIGLLVNNILDEKYSANGYTFSYYASGQVQSENYYYPQAGRNYMFSLLLRF